MASLTVVHPTALARKVLSALLVGDPRRRRPHERRFYPPQRDRVIEDAAMAREMYRL